VPWFVLTDDPDDLFKICPCSDPARPDGSDGVDYLALLPPTGEEARPPPITTKGFALLAALENFDTAIYLDADRASPNFRGSTPSIRYRRAARRGAERR